MRQIDAFELWVWKRLLRTPWTERKTNEWVLQQINEDNTITRSLVNIIRKGRLFYFGHIIRQHNSLEKTITGGKLRENGDVVGQRSVGLTLSLKTYIDTQQR